MRARLDMATLTPNPVVTENAHGQHRPWVGGERCVDILEAGEAL